MHMKKKWLWIPVGFLVVMAGAGCCVGDVDSAAESQTKTTQLLADEEVVDRYFEDWLEDTQEQTAPQEEQTEPVEDAPPSPSEETKPLPTESQGETEDVDMQAPVVGSLRYEAYLAMSAQERQAYMESFPTPQEAMLWYENAKKAYDESRDIIDIGGGDVDLGDVMESLGK